jgi:kumamolisin
MQAVNDTMKEAAVLGIPVCLASGDDGSDDQVGDGLAHVDFPSTSSFVLSVGGTSLNKKTGAEVVWKEGDGLRADGGGSGGGGVSSVFPRPSYQQNINISSVNPGMINGRVIPDVCANAAGQTGYFTVANGQAGIVGGTSAAAPLWAALIARINAALGKGVGFLTPLLYQSNPKTGGEPLGQAALKDITTGNNISAAAGGYTAGPGYDAASGWGSPNGAKLLSMLP